MALRLAGVAIGAHVRRDGAWSAIVVAQVVATAAIGVAGLAAFRRFPRAPSEPLGDDSREIRALRAPARALATGRRLAADDARRRSCSASSPTPPQVGYFRTAQAPQQGFAALSAPARLILLTEQTRDWERGEHATRARRRAAATASARPR